MTSAQVPRFARFLVQWCTAPEDREFVLADLEDAFRDLCDKHSPGEARRWYRRQALQSVPAGLRGRLCWRRMRHAALHEERGMTPQPHRPSRAMRSWFGALRSDLGYGVRGISRRPVFAVVVALSIGLGIGAVTSSFVLINTLLFLQPTGLAAPDELVTIFTHEPGDKRYGSTSYPDYQDLLERVPALEDAATVALRPVSLGLSDAFNVLAEEVSANYFQVTGLTPTLGRAFSSAESKPSAPSQVVVLGHGLWSRHFDADPAVIGRSVVLDRRSFTVIGVAPPKVVSRRAPLRPEVWVPLGALEAGNQAGQLQAKLQNRNARDLLIFARLAKNATLTELEGQLETASTGLRATEPEWTQRDGQTRAFVAVEESASRVNPDARRLFIALGGFLLGVTALVLLIACSNVASLLMARTARRRKELALRAALGASRGRIVVMLMLEGIVPTVAGTMIGVGVARLYAWKMASVQPPNGFPLPIGAEVDLRVLVFAVVVAGLAWTWFTMLPALHGTRKDLQSNLKALGRRRRGWGRPRGTLVVLQCAAALVLIVGAGLFMRSLDEALEMDLGFDPDGVAMVSKTLDAGRFSREQSLAEFRTLREEIEAAPGISESAYARGVELTLAQSPVQVQVRVGGNQATTPAENPHYNAVSSGYFDLLGIPVIAGRAFNEAEALSQNGVAVINETFAERHWPGDDPVGRTFEIIAGSHRTDQATDRPEQVTVLGVVRDGKYFDFDDSPAPYFWIPFAHDGSRSAVFLARGERSDEQIATVLARVVALDAGEVRRVEPSTLERQLSIQFAHLRTGSTMLSIGSGIGLFLAMIGVYGLVSLTVGERRREMAVRIALGAKHREVMSKAIGEGIRSTAFGLLLGLAVALPAARLLRSILWGIGPGDPASFLGGTALLVVACLAAGALPTRRLLKMSPVETLREDG